ncbi:MAG: CRTAC1 family protein [Sandaracinaceae bacterium]|nr:CRTAC1 family protein [Sandaracinaceae bacterium]
MSSQWTRRRIGPWTACALRAIGLAIGLAPGCGTGSSTDDVGLDAGLDAVTRDDDAMLGDASFDARVDDASELDGAMRDAADDAGLLDVLDGTSDAGAPPAWFEDLVRTSGLGFDRGAAEEYATLADRMSGGVCVLDADGAGPIDVFFALRPVIVDGVPTAAGSSRLFVADAPLAYHDATAERGLSDVGDAWGCLAFDEDADGDDDLLVYGVGLLSLYENDGATFRRTTRLEVSPARWDAITSAAAGDLDDDGDLDLVVGSFLDLDPAHTPLSDCGIPGHRCIPNVYSLRALPNRLMLRGPDGVYEDATARLAPDLARAEATLALGVSDLDGDGHTDIFVCNDLGSRDRDRPLVRGADGVFRDASATLGMSGTASGYGTDCMGWTSYDIDGNGRFDHVLSDFEGQTTTVHLCGTDGFCEDVGRLVGTRGWSETTFRWGVALIDVDRDGLVELLESTGHVHTDLEIGAIALDAPQYESMHVSSWDGAALIVPSLPRDDGSRLARTTRGIAITDLDDDGAPDVLLAPSLGVPAILHNVAPSRGHWLTVRLIGRGMNREAAGAVVTVETSRATVRRERHVGEGYAGNFDRRLFFGLGSATGTAAITVRWPDGTTTTASSELDRELTISAL